jgi:hypothetical protein
LRLWASQLRGTVPPVSSNIDGIIERLERIRF